MIEFSAKGRFLKDTEAIRSHRDYVTSAAFQRAAEAAICQYASALAAGSVNPDPADASARFHRMAGAREFLAFFINMGEQAETATRLTTPNLQQPK